MSSVPRAAIIDHSFHLHTSSTVFFEDYVGEHFAVDKYYDDSWNGGSGFNLEELNKNEYSVIFSMQIIYSPQQYRRLRCKKIVIIPMYDAVCDKNEESWIPYKEFIFLCYCQKLHKSLLSIGIRTYYLQFFPDPAILPNFNYPKKEGVFFWHRTNSITVSMVLELLKNTLDMELHIHNTPDPGFAPIGEEELQALHIDKTSAWFRDKAEYLECIAQYQIYIAPRLYEGIGFSFLEAMAVGCCVVAPNLPTMNEYIIDGVNGLLFDPRAVKRMNVGIDFEKLGRSARQSIIDGRKKYMEKAREVMVEILKDLDSGRIWRKYPLKYLVLFAVRKIKGILRSCYSGIRALR